VSVVFVGQMLNGIDDGLLGSFQALDSWRAALDYPGEQPFSQPQPPPARY